MTAPSSHDTRRRRRIDVGLYERVTAAGEIRYDVIVWQGGKQQVQAQPRGTTEKRARQAALRARAAAGDGAAPLATAVRLGKVIDDYLIHAEARTRILGKGRMSPTTLATYRSRLEEYVRPPLGQRKLSQLGAGDVLRVVDRCHEAGLSDWSTHGVLTALRAVLRFARENELMSNDPFARVPRDRLPAQRAQSEARALRPNEAALLLDRLRRKKPASVAHRDYVAGCLLVDAGLRVSEAAGLTWAEISLLEDELTVRGQLARSKAGAPPRIVPPKTANGYRTVGLLPRLKAALEELYAGEDDAAFVLRTRTGRPLSQRNIYRSIKAAGEEAGLGHVTPHVLRRTLGTALSQTPTAPAAAAVIMGHSLEVFYGNYVKPHRDKLEREQARKALVKLGLGRVPRGQAAQKTVAR